MYWAINALSYHLIKESSVIMSEDKRLSTGQGIVITVFPIAGAVLGYMVGTQIDIVSGESYSSSWAWLGGIFVGFGLGNWFGSLRVRVSKNE